MAAAGEAEARAKLTWLVVKQPDHFGHNQRESQAEADDKQKRLGAARLLPVLLLGKTQTPHKKEKFFNGRHGYRVRADISFIMAETTYHTRARLKIKLMANFQV